MAFAGGTQSSGSSGRIGETEKRGRTVGRSCVKVWSSTAMVISMKGNSTRGGAMGVGFIISSPKGGMKGIGSMGNMMGMGSRAGREGAGIGASIGRD